MVFSKAVTHSCIFSSECPADEHAPGLADNFFNSPYKLCLRKGQEFFSGCCKSSAKAKKTWRYIDFFI